MTGRIRRTKIVCTLGPSTDEPGVLAQLIEQGLSVARINAAHGAREQHEQRVAAVRESARSLGRPVGILIDLPGPKFRLGTLPSGSLELRLGAEVVLGAESMQGPGVIPVSYKKLVQEVAAGESIYLADGTVKLMAKEIDRGLIHCRVAIGGTVRSGSGINLPESRLSVKLPTEDDLPWLAFAIEQQVEWVGTSFVSTAEDLARIRQGLGSAGETPMVLAKIEKRQALEQLESIIEAADGVMVARGDLGVETPLAEVPIVQKRIIAAANRQGRPVVTATQMLESMVEHPAPTRAEVTDIANAILDGTDAVMLSAETAIGRHPVEVVKVLGAVIEATEASYPYAEKLAQLPESASASVADAVGAVAYRLAFDLRARAIVVPSAPASTVFRIAGFRPQAPIVALGGSARLVQQMAIAWDVCPVLLPSPAQAPVEFARHWMFEQQLAKPGDRIIVVAASSTGQGSDSLQVVQL
ncbi:MAG: pyruvate kinase [Candidatus Omnitrophica bacterium]|nr:pyruvate kinase [Candidatus Omnitrophota bacterium]